MHLWIDAQDPEPSVQPNQSSTSVCARGPFAAQKTPVRQYVSNYCFNGLSYRCSEVTSAGRPSVRFTSLPHSSFVRGSSKFLYDERDIFVTAAVAPAGTPSPRAATAKSNRKAATKIKKKTSKRRICFSFLTSVVPCNGSSFTLRFSGSLRGAARALEAGLRNGALRPTS